MLEIIKEKTRTRFISLLLLLGVLGVASGYHGFSIGGFYELIGVDPKPIWGLSRPIRSDDYLQRERPSQGPKNAILEAVQAGDGAKTNRLDGPVLTGQR